MAVNIKVATYNAPHRLQHKGLKADIQKLANQGCVIIALQEVTDGDPAKYAPSGWGWERPTLARSTALLYKKSVFTRVNGGGYRMHSTSAPSAARYITWADLKHTSNTTIRVGSIHLPAFKTSSQARAKEFRYQENRAANWLNVSSNRILMGDFNASPTGKAWMPNMLKVGTCYSPTFQTGPTAQVIDHVWVRKGQPRPKGLSSMAGGSDHKALIVQVTIGSSSSSSSSPENPRQADGSEAQIAQDSGYSGYSGPASTSTTGSDPGFEAGVTKDISGLPFEFNPPLHPLNFHKRVELATSDPTAVRVRQEQQYQQKDYVKGLGLSEMTTLRLGRITMGDTAENGVMAEHEGKRWGFRFLYNPTTWQGGSQFSKDINPDFASNVPLIVTVGLEVIKMQLLLDRGPDLAPGANRTDYLPNINSEQWRELQKRGTNYDLEYLYRVANVQRVTTKDDQDTADMGLMLPNTCFLHLGKMMFKGRMYFIDAQHLIFTKNMVPTRTMLTFGFQRVVSMANEDFDDFARGSGWDSAAQRENQEAEEEGGSTASPGTAAGGTYEGYWGGFTGDINKTVPWNGTIVDPAQRDAIAGMIVRTAMISNEIGPGGDRGRRAALIGLIAAQQESRIQNLDNGFYDANSVGVFQQRPPWWGTPAQINIVQNAIDAFFGLRTATHTTADGLIDKTGWWTQPPGNMAQAVQQSNHPDAYAPHIPDMEKLLSTILKETRLR